MTTYSASAPPAPPAAARTSGPAGSATPQLPGSAATVPGGRKHAADLPSDAFGTACPVVADVPAMLAEDPLFHELCDAFDELLAPMESALDCFSAYLDPRTAPPDFVDWLGELVGAQAEPGWPIGQRREHLATAVDSNRLRGTAEGLRRAAAAAAGVPVERVSVTDPGGVTYSTRPREHAAHAGPAGPADRADPAARTSAGVTSAPVIVVRVLLPKPAPAPSARRRARTYGEQDATADPNAATTTITAAAAGASTGTATAAELVHEAVERVRPVHCQIKIEVGES